MNGTEIMPRITVPRICLVTRTASVSHRQVCTREPDIALWYGLNGLNVWIELDGQQAMEGDYGVIGVSKVFVQLWDCSKLQTDMDSCQDLPRSIVTRFLCILNIDSEGWGSGWLWPSPDRSCCWVYSGPKTLLVSRLKRTSGLHTQ